MTREPLNEPVLADEVRIIPGRPFDPNNPAAQIAYTVELKFAPRPPLEMREYDLRRPAPPRD